MKKRLLLTLALTLAASSSAQAMLLTELLNGGSITAGDKLFDNWSVLFQDKSDGSLVNTDNIDVTALNDGGMNPGPGLQFDILNNELTVTGDGIYAYIDFMFGFRVKVLEPHLAIKDNSLSGFNAFYSYTADGFNNNGNYIRETIGTAAGLDNLGVKNVEFSVLDDISTSKLFDSAEFAPQKNEIWVTKNILVWATDDTDSAGIQGFTQRFSQTVPEPGTFALTMLGLAGVLATRRRKLAVN